MGETKPVDADVPTRYKLVDGRGGAGVGEPGQTVNLVPSLLSGFDSHPPHLSPPPGGVLHSGSEHPAIGRTKVSAHHQVAVPRAVAAASGIKPGDRFRVESAGP